MFSNLCFFISADATTCGLDYTQVNTNIYSYVGFNWFCTLLVPGVLALYFYISIFKTGLGNLCVLSTEQQTISSDSHATRVLSFATCVSVVLIFPCYIISLLAGLGFNIPYVAHVTVKLMSFLAPASVAVSYLCSSRGCITIITARYTEEAVCLPLSNDMDGLHLSGNTQGYSHQNRLCGTFLFPRVGPPNHVEGVTDSSVPNSPFHMVRGRVHSSHDPVRGSYITINSSDVDETMM